MDIMASILRQESPSGREVSEGRGPRKEAQVRAGLEFPSGTGRRTYSRWDHQHQEAPAPLMHRAAEGFS